MATLSLAIALGSSGGMRAGENLDAKIGDEIRDTFWDSRLFDGTAGFPGAIQWFHNPAGIRSGVTASAFEARVEAAFDTWAAADDGVDGEPLVPVVNFGGQTAVTDPFALDGFNVIAWRAELPGGTLAVSPCWVLTQPTTTAADAAGNTVMPVSSGPPIPFPGPVGVIYPAGAMIDCGMRFDSADSWSTADVPSPSGFDVQAIATHEAGHFIGISHSTLGDFTASNPASATMLPFAAQGDATFRTLEEDDRASVLRTYARNRHGAPIAQTVGGRGIIRLTLLKGAACEPATGVSVVAYPTATGIDGPNRVETFSGSHLRRGIPDEPFSGSATLNVPPLPPGESYTIYAKTLEQGQGTLSSQRYNQTTINTNLLDPQNESRTFDHLATVTIDAGESIELGYVGILGCWVPQPTSQVNLVGGFASAPPTAFQGSQIAVSSGFSNVGTVASGPFQAGVYFSTDQTITTEDLFTGFTCPVAALLPGATATCTGSVSVPGAATPGTYFVGLLVDSGNQVAESAEHDNGVAASNPTTVEPNPFNPIVNGSFETGDLTGWTVRELASASNPSLPLSVRGAGVQYPAPTFLAFPYILDYFASQPTDGVWAALHDFNGNDPATTGADTYVNRRELYQDVTLPPGTSTLEFDYRAAWELFRFGSTRDRTFDVELEPAGGGVTLLDHTILIAPNSTLEEDTDNPTGGVGDYAPGRVDLSGFAGQSVRLKFVWNIPEPGTGFGFFQLDNIRINSTLPPNTAPVVNITSPTDGSIITGGQDITFAATAGDAEDGDIAAGVVWSSNLDGVIGSGASVSTSSLRAGAHTITAAVTDSAGLPGSDAIAVTVTSVAPNTAPVVAIAAPGNGAVFTAGTAVSFAGTAMDAENGNISAGLSWTSSRDGAIGSGASFSITTLSGGSHIITASVVDGGGLTGSAAIAVTVNVVNRATADFSTSRGSIGSGTSFRDTWVDDGVYEVLTEAEQGGNPARRRSLLEHTWTFDVAPGAQYVFKVNAHHSGTEDDFTFSYSRDNVVYTPMVTVTASTDGGQQTYLFAGDVRGTLYVRVQDTDGTAGNRQLDSLFVDVLVITSMMGGGSAPAVTITAPADGAVVTAGASVSFAGSASDAQDGNLSGNLTWSSSLDGVIGSGSTFSTATLSAGQHTIAATVTDSSGLQGTASVTMTVRSAAGLTLSAAGYKVKAISHTDLAWSGATTSNVVVIRNGVVIATVPNASPAAGAYTDNIGTKGSGTYLYQVCEPGVGGVCSNVVPVTF